MIEEHDDKHAKEEAEQGKAKEKEARKAYRLFAPVRLDNENLLVVKLLVLRINGEFRLVSGNKSDLSMYDHTIVKKAKNKRLQRYVSKLCRRR